MPPKKHIPIAEGGLPVSPGPVLPFYSHSAPRDPTHRVGHPLPARRRLDGGGPGGGERDRDVRRRIDAVDDSADHDNWGLGDGEDGYGYEAPGEPGFGPARAGTAGRGTGTGGPGSTRGARRRGAWAAQRPAARVAYLSTLPLYEAAVASQHSRVLQVRQDALDLSFRDMGGLKHMYALLGELVLDETELAEHLRALDASVMNRLKVTHQEVRFIGMGIEGKLRVPTWTLDGKVKEAFTPHPSTCFSGASSPVSIGNGTIFFDWDLLDWLSQLFFLCGVSVAG